MLNSNYFLSELREYCGLYRKELEDFKGACILVTGAAGLIGSYLADLFLEANKYYELNVHLVLVDRNRDLLHKRFANQDCSIIYADIVTDKICDIKVDYIFHCASNTSPLDYANKPIDTILTNVIGTNNILRFALRNNTKRILFCSSVEVYGKNKGDVDDFSEDYSGFVDCNTVRAGYPSAKRCAESLLNAYKTEYPQIEFVTARIGRFYGPTVVCDDTKASTQFIYSAVKGESILLKSDGLQEYSWGYVGDCVTALIIIMLKGENGHAYNVADPQSKCLLIDFATACANAGDTHISFAKKTDMEKIAYSSITKATLNTNKIEDLGWKAIYNVKEGTNRTVLILKNIMGE